MSERWFISDTHFGHANILKFSRADGTPLRPNFNDIDHMDEVIIDRWNKTIAPDDDVYHLGDLCFQGKIMERILPRLNGKKRLILGNHDRLDMGAYRKHFKRISSWRHFTDDGCALICTHFPLHESSFLGRYEGRCVNVHGHIHARVIPSKKYVNICVEQTDYTPVNYDVLRKHAMEAGRAD